MSDTSWKFRTRHQFGKKMQKLSRKRDQKFIEIDAVITDAATVGSERDVANEIATGTAAIPAPVPAPMIASTSVYH